MSQRLVPWEDRYLTVNGLRLHYLDWQNADGEPLLFLHGLRSHAHTFDPFAAMLQPYFHVLALDQRGHGESDWAPDGYDEQRYVSDIEGFLTALASPPLVVIGHSMGARNAWAYSARNPEQVSLLVLVDLGPEVSRQGLDRMQSSPAPEAFGCAQEALRFMRAANPRPSDDMVRLRVLHNLRRLPDGRWAWRYDPALRDSQRAQEGTLARPEDAWAALAKIACPTLIVRGAESDLLSPEVADRMTRVIPKARLVTISGAGHTVPADRPLEFAGALTGFLKLAPH